MAESKIGICFHWHKVHFLTKTHGGLGLQLYYACLVLGNLQPWGNRRWIQSIEFSSYIYLWIGSSTLNTRLPRCVIVSLIYMQWLHLRCYLALSFEILSGTFSFLGSLRSFFLLKQLLHTCCLSCVAEEIRDGGSVVEQAGLFLLWSNWTSVQHARTSKNALHHYRKWWDKMVPIASSFRTVRQIYGRGRNETSKEKRVGAKSENSQGSLEIFKLPFKFSLFLVFLFHSDVDSGINGLYLRCTEAQAQPRRSLGH